MRYSVHPSRAFRNRIAKSIGVLVAAALIATLGLPSAAQAQTLANNTANTDTGHGGIDYMDGTGFVITWTTRSSSGIDNWIVTVTKPNGTKVVVNQYSTVQTTLGAVETMGDGGAMNLGEPGTVTLTYLATDQGEWWFQVSACTVPLDAETDKGICKPSSNIEAGAAVGYTHGPPAAPTNLAANAVPTGVALTWTDMTSDRAITGYQYAFKMTAAGKPDWKAITGKSAQVIVADDGEHTFMLRAVGSSDNSTATMEDTPVPGVADSVTVTVGDGEEVEEEEEEEEGEPVPTLPEIAALFLGMLLLGSGAYLIRGRQSGGLTNA